ncbi:MAG: aldo/keto reductase [Paracoccaceae bacterium]|nr:aldo/keto reductase [Paracoccaceae bacterium]
MHDIAANGARMPAIGLGTWTLKGETCAELVAGALRAGYRHLDTAAMYENEAAVGEGLRASGIDRDEVFVTTKIWLTDLADGDLQRSVEASLGRLGLDQVDLTLIHWPSKSVPMAESIGALNDVAERGLARHIGISNFPVALIDEAVALSGRPLACNQVEYHPYLSQDRVLEACRRHGMAMVSYCPLARGSELFNEPAVAGPAERHGRTGAQIVLRWHVQQEGVVAIPRSSNPGRIAQNLDVFDFTLDDGEMAAISALGSRRHRICNFEFSPDWDPV